MLRTFPVALAASEKAVYDRLAGQALPARKRLVQEVIRVAERREFTYREDDHHPVGLVPLVLAPRLLRGMQAVTRVLYRFQQRAPDFYRANYNGFAELFRLERRTKAWFEATPPRRPRPWELLSRPDYGMRLMEGRLEPVLFELNSLMLGGLYIQSVGLDIMRDTILPRLGVRAARLGLAPSADLLAFAKNWLLRGRAKAGGPGLLALVENWPPGGGFSELPRIARYLKEKGVDARHGDPRRLELKNGEVRLNGRKVGFAYRDFSFEDVGGPDNKRMRAFKQLWLEGKVTPWLPADFDQKGILECFTSPEFAGLFTRREAALLRRHAPWTRVLSPRKTSDPRGRGVDLLEYALRNQERLVIKPSWSSGGDGILIGKKIKPARWRAAVDRAVQKTAAFALQEYVDAPPRPSAYLRGGEVCLKDCRYTVGMFHEGESFGMHLRVSPKDIVNVAQGGALSPVYLA